MLTHPQGRRYWQTALLFSLTLSLTLLSPYIAAAEFERVSVASLDLINGQAIHQPAFWFRATQRDRAPAILLLHGCGGPYDRKGELSKRMYEYAALLNNEGFHVLITDSLSPRGERELCTQKTGTRKITQTNRRRDAQGALRWLTEQADVDRSKLVVLGWSNGGSSVLAMTNATHPEVKNFPIKPARAVAFYPGCKDDLKLGYQPVAPLLLLLGGADDWTPAAACQALAESSAQPKPEVITYPNAYHGFDGTAPVILRRDVPNGENPGQGVHVGGNPVARTQSQERLVQYLRPLLMPD